MTSISKGAELTMSMVAIGDIYFKVNGGHLLFRPQDEASSLEIQRLQILFTYFRNHQSIHPLDYRAYIDEHGLNKFFEYLPS